MTALLGSYIWIWQDAFRGEFFVVCALYFAIAISAHLRRGETLREIGLRRDNAGQAASLAVVLALPVALVLLACGAWLGTWEWWGPVELAKRWVGRSVWGAAQQYGLTAFYYRRYSELLPGRWPPIFAAAFTFALFHLPNPLLTLLTLWAGVVSCLIYRRAPNLFVLGLTHGALSVVVSFSLPDWITFGQRVGPGFWKLWEQAQQGLL